jgi:hypothetical protein
LLSYRILASFSSWSLLVSESSSSSLSGVVLMGPLIEKYSSN